VAIPRSTELTGERLADEFRVSWQLAQEGAAPAAVIENWVRAVSDRPLADDELGSAWERFFAAGGALFRVIPSPRKGIAGMRYAWGWPLTGNSLTWMSDKTGDNLTIYDSPTWRASIENRETWRQADNWVEAAAWMRDRAPVDPRVAAWWVAGEDASPRSPVLNGDDAVIGIRSWWAGDWYPTGVPVVKRYELPEPAEDGFWYAWLRWDPNGSARSDGLADVLGLRRAGKGVDVVWWSVRPDGTVGEPVRAVAEDGVGLHIDRVEELVTQVLVLERRPSNVRWIEATLR
jgi:hypothetical protein